jgi:transposase
VETTPTTTPDDKMLDTIQAALAEHALLPQEHLVDYGDTDSKILVGSERDYGVTIVGPVAADPSWQAREGTGFDHSAFTIDWESHTATCPQGQQRRKWLPDTDVAGQDVIHIRFAKKDCQGCAVRSACTRAKTEPRTLTVRTQGYYEVLQAARRHQRTAEFQEPYAQRASIEGILSQGVRAFDWRRSRYRGLAKTHLQLILMATAINLVRVVARLTDPRPPKRRAAPCKVVLEALQGERTIHALAAAYGVHPIQITQWKKVVLEALPQLLSRRRGTMAKDEDALKAAPYQQIGQLKVELDWLKKSGPGPLKISACCLSRGIRS